MRTGYTYYLDVELKITPEQWSTFVVPTGISVIWDKYNFQSNTVIGRFYVSEAHLRPDERLNEEHLNRFLESLGEYVVSEYRSHEGFKDVPHWGQHTVTYEGHPYLQDLPKNIDVHRSDKENNLKKPIIKSDVIEVNESIMKEAELDRNLKKYRDDRLKPSETEIYSAILEEI